MTDFTQARITQLEDYIKLPRHAEIIQILKDNNCTIIVDELWKVMFWYEDLYYSNVMERKMDSYPNQPNRIRFELYDRIMDDSHPVYEFPANTPNLKEEVCRALRLVKQWYVEHPNHPLRKCGMDL